MVLVGIPVGVFCIPAATGHLVMGGDDLIQSYPLRILVGEQIRHGHLPLWNPLIWSGTPLLAGFNAGAAFPLTWLFVVLPPQLAWVLTEVATYSLASVGLYAFLRLHSLSRGASVLGASTFAFAGFMSAQIVHIDLVQGAALLPWVLVALRQIATRSSGEPAWRWVVLLGASLGLTVLTGSPQAAIDMVVVGGIYGLYVLRLNWHASPRTVGLYAAGALLGILLSAAQWLPGIAFVSESQRGGFSYAFFGTGSLQPSLTILALVPYLFGGFGRLGVPSYFGSYNFAEVTLYVGMLPLMASLSLLTRRFRRQRGTAEWAIWYVVIGVSLILAMGTFTPVGHLLAHIPLYNSQRLQNRNLVGVDLGLAILFAFWIDKVTRRSDRHAGMPVSWPSRLLPALPALAVAAVYVTFLAWSGPLLNSLGATDYQGLLAPMRPYLTITLAIALLAAAAACFYDRVEPRRRMRMLAAVTVLDLGFFTLYQSWLTFPSASWVDANAPPAQSLARLAGSARFAVYNPRLYSYDSLLALGQPDLNVINHVASSQGYGSVVSASYQAATGSHDQSSLYPVTIQGTTLDQLDTSVLLSRIQYFATQLNPPKPAPAPAPPSVTSTIRPPPLPPPPPPLAAGAQRTWYFGTLAEVSTVTVPVGGTGVPAGTVGLRNSEGKVYWPPLASSSTTAGGLEVRFARPQLASGVVLQSQQGSPMRAGTPRVGTQDYGPLLLNGPLQNDVKPPHWSFAGVVGEYAAFRNTQVKGPWWLEGPNGGPSPGGRVKLDSSSSTGGQVFAVSSASPVRLVRSVAFEAGWTAEATPASGGPARPVAVSRVGPVQGVDLPAGSWKVSFAYRPRDATAGLAVSAATLVALAVVAALLERRRRLGAAARSRGSGPS